MGWKCSAYTEKHPHHASHPCERTVQCRCRDAGVKGEFHNCRAGWDLKRLHGGPAWEVCTSAGPRTHTVCTALSLASLTRAAHRDGAWAGRGRARGRPARRAQCSHSLVWQRRACRSRKAPKQARPTPKLARILPSSAPSQPKPTSVTPGSLRAAACH